MEQYALSFVPERRIFSLRELSDGIRAALDRGFSNIWVSGEISGTKLVPSGHCYFTLKDADAQIKCVCWKLSYWRLKFKPKDGIQVLVRGRVDIYEPAKRIPVRSGGHRAAGRKGALRLAFEQLKQKLLAEGLFESAEARKRPLPRFPFRIGIVTSPKGAVIRDFIQILSRRFPGLHIRLFPARVQGAKVPSKDICRGLEYFGRTSAQADEPVVRAPGETLGAGHSDGARRRVAGRSLDVQRRSGCARHCGFANPGGFRHRARDRRHNRGFRRRPPCPRRPPPPRK